MKRFSLFAFIFAGLAACEAPPSAPTPREPTVGVPSFSKLFNDQFDISGLFFNPCPPTELVAIEGSIHTHAEGEVTPTSFNVTFHTNFQGIAGVGLTSGDRYSVLQNVKNDIESSSSTLDQTFDVRSRMVRQGSADNLWFRSTVRITAPPFTVTIIRSELECRG